MSDIPFNINDYVLVRLKPRGKLIHRKQHDELRKSVPSIGKYHPPKVDADGFSRWQLWELMQTFGPHISLSAEPPFETVVRFEVREPVADYPIHEGEE